MSSVYRRGNIWWGRVKDSTGEWECISTKVKIGGIIEKKRAEAVAFETERMMQGLTDESPTEAYFVKIARDVAKRANPEEFTEKTLADFLNRWISSCEERRDMGELSKQSVAYYRSVIGTFLKWAGAKGKLSFRKAGVRMFEEYRDHAIKAGKKSERTVAKDLKVISVPFEAAWKSGSIAANPVKAVKKPQATGDRRQVFTPSDVSSMLKTLTGEWLTVFLFGLCTAARLGDCVRMRWEMVDIFKGTLTFVQSKTKRKNPSPLTIPLHPILWEHLKSIRPGKGLISSGLASKIGAKDDIEGSQSGVLSVEFGQLMDKAGVDRVTSVSKSGRSKSLKSFHSLRHTINSLMANQGMATEEVRSRLTGHKLKGMNHHYTHTEIEQVRTALNLIAFAS